MSYGLIYKMTNKINGMIYIGQTTQSLKRRIASHKSHLKNTKTKLAKALKKYTFENFDIYTIDYAENQEELNQKEIYWINYYDTLNRYKGYNTKEGGSNGKFSKEGLINLRKSHIRRKVYCIETKEIFNSIKEAEEKYNCKSYISRACRGKNNIVKGLHWCYLEDKNKPELHILPRGHKKRVYCLEEDKIYDSREECGKVFNITGSAVRNVCNKNKKCGSLIYKCKGFHLCYLKDKEELVSSF